MSKKTKIIVRLGKIKDLEIIQNFQIQMEHIIEDTPMPDEVGKKGVNYILSTAPKDGFYLVAEIKDTIVGCLRISYERSVSSNGVFWWIQNVFVAENHRNKGIFQLLYKEVFKMSKSYKNIVGIKLHVHKNNLKAQKAYEKAGMKKLPEFVYFKRL